MTSRTENSVRASLQDSKRVVVKLGTRVIAGAGAGSIAGAPDRKHLSIIVAELAKLRASGKEVVLVSSGAIGAGIEALGLEQRPTEVTELQMCASVGQVRLMSIYDELFSSHKLRVGQVLLTGNGFKDDTRLQNMKNTMETLLKAGVFPIVNENDAVAVEELCYGDNDCLAAVLASEIKADLLVLLTTTNGLMNMNGSESERVSFLSEIDEGVFSHVQDKADSLSTGGMKSKLEAAKFASDDSIITVIADGRDGETLSRLFAGESLGTLIDGK